MIGKSCWSDNQNWWRLLQVHELHFPQRFINGRRFDLADNYRSCPCRETSAAKASSELRRTYSRTSAMSSFVIPPVYGHRRGKGNKIILRFRTRVFQTRAVGRWVERPRLCRQKITTAAHRFCHRGMQAALRRLIKSWLGVPSLEISDGGESGGSQSEVSAHCSLKASAWPSAKLKG